jgi:hypothetical protein
MRLVVLLCSVLAGCGRVGFGTLETATAIDASDSDPVDTTIDSPTSSRLDRAPLDCSTPISAASINTIFAPWQYTNDSGPESDFAIYRCGNVFRFEVGAAANHVSVGIVEANATLPTPASFVVERVDMPAGVDFVKLGTELRRGDLLVLNVALARDGALTLVNNDAKVLALGIPALPFQVAWQTFEVSNGINTDLISTIVVTDRWSTKTYGPVGQRVVAGFVASRVGLTRPPIGTNARTALVLSEITLPL